MFLRGSTRALSGTTQLSQLERGVTPKIAHIVHVVIGGHFILFNDNSNHNEGETLTDFTRELNKRANKHLTDLPPEGLRKLGECDRTPEQTGGPNHNQQMGPAPF